MAIHPFLSELLPHARKGHIHAILGLAPDDDLHAKLQEHPNGDWIHGHAHARLLALFIAEELGHTLDGVIYDFAEHRFFVNDDEGHYLQRLCVERAVVYGTKRYAVYDANLAESCAESALEGPDPEGARGELKAALSDLSPGARTRIGALLERTALCEDKSA